MKAELGNVKTGGFFLLYATDSIMNTTDEVREIEKNQIYWICLETGCGRVNHHKRAIISRLKEFSLFVFVFWSFWMLSRPKFMIWPTEIFEIIKISKCWFLVWESIITLYFFFKEPHHLILRVPRPAHDMTSHRRSIRGIRNIPPPLRKSDQL